MATLERYPAHASQEYKDARAELMKAELELSHHIERVAEMRRALPPGAEMKDYTFIEGPRDLTKDGPYTKVTLYELAADGRSLVLNHMMFPEDDDKACPNCSFLIDGLSGVERHLKDHVNLAIVGKADIRKLRAWALDRGWNNLRILSSKESTFNKDMQVESPPWAPKMNQVDGTSVFKKDKDGVLRHVYMVNATLDNVDDKRFEYRACDTMSPYFGVMDIIPEGRGDD